MENNETKETVNDAESVVTDDRTLKLRLERLRFLIACVNNTFSTEELNEEANNEGRILDALNELDWLDEFIAQGKHVGYVEVRDYFKREHMIYTAWDADDIQNVRPDLTDEQAWEVLQYVERKHDAEVGINWHALEWGAEELYGLAPDEDEVEESLLTRAAEIYAAGNGESTMTVEEAKLILQNEPSSVLRAMLPDDSIAARLEYLRQELRAERISYGELHELQSLAEHIDSGDVELLEAVGVPEFPGEDAEANAAGEETDKEAYNA